LLPKIFEALRHEPNRPVIAASVSAIRPAAKTLQRLARTIADAARKTERTIVAYSCSPLGGPLDPEIVKALHSGRRHPYLLGSRCHERAQESASPARSWRQLTQRQVIDSGGMHAPGVSAHDWSPMASMTLSRLRASP